MKSKVRNYIQFAGICLIALMLVFSVSNNVKAAERAEFHVKNISGKKGEEVTIPVQFNSKEEVGGFQFAIYYDKDVLEFQSLEKGELIQESDGGIFDYNHIAEKAKIIVVYVVPDTVKDEGSIVNVKFRLKKDCGQKLPIGIDVDQVVDGSDDSKSVDSVVTGVDEEFQKTIVQAQTNDGKTNDNVSDGEEKTDPTEKVEQEDKDKEQIAEQSSSDSKKSKEKNQDENGADSKEKGQQKNKIYAGIVIIMIAAAIGVGVILKKRAVKRR